MKRLALVVTLMILVVDGLVWSQEPPLPRGARLGDIVARKYPAGNVFIGGTTAWSKLRGGAGIVLDREFRYVTPENDFKESTIHPQPGIWDWKAADAWVKRCGERGQVLRIHGPISPQASRWAKDDRRTAAELKQNLDEFLTALCKRYDKSSCVKWIDVVNETVQPNGEWFGPLPGSDQWENPWPTIGYDTSSPLQPPLYIRQAFAIATRHAPHKKLIINQHAGMEEPMWRKIKNLVEYLRAEGMRVDGIGWQAHVSVGWETQGDNLDRLRLLIDWAHANRLSFHVTEANVWLRKKKDYAAQARTFAAIVQVLLEKRESGMVTWNTWNLSDADSGGRYRALKGCLFDDQYRAKPAYYAIQRVLQD